MKLLLRIATITLVSVLVILQSGTVHCANQNPRKPFSWNLNEVDLSKAVQAVSEYTGQNFEYDPALLKGKVTVIINTEIAPDLAYPILEAILAGRGFALVPVIEANLIKIVPAPDAISSPLPTDVGKEVGDMTPYENLVTQILPVEYAQASDLVAVLDSFRSAVGRVDAYAPANLLIITERAAQVKRLVDLVQRIDVAGFEQRWEVIPLEYQSADVLAQKITDVLSEEVSAIAAGQRTPPGARARPRPGRPTERASARAAASRGPRIVGAVQTPLRIIPDEWSNSLIVVGVEAMRLKVRQLVEQLDVDTPFEEGNFHVYIVQNADVMEVLDSLNDVISGGSGGGSRTGGRQPQQSGQPGGSTGRGAQAFAGDVGLAAYEPTNALLITASPQDWRILERVLKVIDVPERQVYVEAVIMEVTVKDGVTVGVDLAALDEDDVVAASLYGDLASLATALATGGGSTLAVLNAATGGTVGVLDGTIPNPLNPDQQIPLVPALLTAIQTVTDLDVLSAPAILTTKISSGSRQRGRQGGTQAGPLGMGGGRTGGMGGQTRMSGSGITVGKNVPVIRGSARPLAQSAVAPTMYSSVGRQQVGVILDVSPQIIADEYVKLEIRAEVSDIIPSEVGMDVNVSGPTFSVSEIQDTVVIRDGYMGVLGGLMRQSEGRSRSQIPILGDIPLLGFFFRKTTRTQEKHNLVVIITPHIIKTDEDLDKLTTRSREEYDLQRLEMHEDMNFWRRIFKKVEVKREPAERSRRASRVQKERADRVMGRNFNW